MSTPSDPSFADPRLTAYLLDELESEERAAFEAELARRPDLQAALADLRRVSSALGRAYREEPVPESASGQKAPRQRSVTMRELSPSARAGRIARLKYDAPKLGKTKSNRFGGMAAALVASLALAGIIILQRAGEGGNNNDDRRLAAVQPDDGNRGGPSLSERIEQHLVEERQEALAQYDAVSNEVAQGLEGIQSGPSVPATAPTAPAVSSETMLAEAGEADWLALERRSLNSFEQGPNKEDEEARRRREAAVASIGTPRPSLGAVGTGDWVRPPVVGGPRIVSRGFRSPASAPRAGFALRVDTASYGAVRASLEADRLPQPADVKIEELINHFRYAEQDPDRADPPFGVEMEVAQAPWEPVHYLVRVTLKACDDDHLDGEDMIDGLAASGANAEIRFNPTQVAAYRLLGYEQESGTNLDGLPAELASAPQSLASGHEITALYEVVPVGAPTTFGGVDESNYETAPTTAFNHADATSEMLWMEVRYKRAPVDPSQRVDFILHVPTDIPSWRQASRAFRWAAAVASFGMELKSDPWRGRLDWNLIEMLARSGLEETDESDGDQSEFLRLIDHARALAGERDAAS